MTLLPGRSHRPHSRLRKKFLTRLFTMILAPTVSGLIIPDMGMYGCQMLVTALNHMLPMATGFTAMQAGFGHLTIIGDGLHSIMGAGSTIIHMAGCGFRAMSGRLHGLAGGGAMIITAGRP